MKNLDKIHLGKWEEVMPKIDASSVDLIVTSPPYNVDLGNNKHKKDSYIEYGDNMPYTEYLEWMTNLFTECNRILKHGGRLCVNIGDGANGQIPTHVDFTYRLINLDKFSQKLSSNFEPFKLMTTIVWDKKQIGASTAWGSFQSPSQPSFPTPFEFIIVVGKGTLKHEGDPTKATISKQRFIENSRALWSFPPETRMMELYEHPAVFPEELPRRLIDHLSYAEDLVLDPFSGSGTTCSVAKKMNRHYIGIEMSKKYYEKSLQRLGMIPDLEVKDGNIVPKWMS